jgi:hypothetical protein
MTASHGLRRFRSGVIRIAVLSAIPWIAAGCGGRQTIEGTATLDDRPLEQGYINFRPMPGAKGPPVGGPIEKGKYVIEPKAPLGGSFRVEITAMGKTGRKITDGAGARIDIEGQILPARYNAESTLQVEIKPRQCNKFPFSLKSK